MARVQFHKRAATNLIVIHCAATKPSMDVGVREIRQWHLQRGFLDVGYHFIIRRSGEVEQGRAVDQIGAHVKGYNAESVGICLVGGIDEKGKPEANFMAAQMESLKSIIKSVQKLFPNCDVVGHHTLDHGKACPSFNVSKWLTSGVVETSDKG